jgi:hypothetical protein
MSKYFSNMLGIGILAVVGTATATSATGAVNRSPDAETAKFILAELLAIDATYDKGAVAAVQALRTRFLAAGFPSPPSLHRLLLIAADDILEGSLSGPFG